jgi:hypothetical protein
MEIVEGQYEDKLIQSPLHSICERTFNEYRKGNKTYQPDLSAYTNGLD